MKHSIPIVCSMEFVDRTEEYLVVRGKRDMFSCIGTDFEQPEQILERLKSYSSRLVITGPAHDTILRNAGYHVIPLKSHGFNIINTLMEAKKYSNKIVFIWRSKRLVDIDGYHPEELGLQLISTCCHCKNDVEVQVKEFMAQGFSTFVGHQQVCDIVHKLGGNAICYYTASSYIEAVEEAIYQAQMFVSTLSGNQTKRLMDILRVGIMTVDKNLCCVALNAEGERMLGIEAKNVLGNSVTEIWPDAQLRKCVEESQTLLRHTVNIRDRLFDVDYTVNAQDSAALSCVILFQYAGAGASPRRAKRKEIGVRYSFDDIVGSSRVLQDTIAMAKVFAETSSPILITGETGTGKELFAQSIHAHSLRSANPFLAINCAAISESLLESELFGYEQGAFTGASRDGKTGVFELANMGTLFLDEIGEISQAMQVRLLRVLQEKQIRRIGGREDIPVNIRIIAATNRDLEEMVAAGRFREDLYYRLNVLRLTLPPLRSRKEDIPEQVYAICRKYNLESSGQFIIFEILRNYKDYTWPGNVRELENIVQRISVMQKCQLSEGSGRDRQIPISVIPEENPERMYSAPVQNGEQELELMDYRQFMQKQEQAYLRKVIAHFGGNRTRAADYMGMSRTTLWAKLKYLDACGGDDQK